MRKSILLLLMVTITGTGFSQQTTTPEAEFDQSYFSKKSKNQKTAGWILTTAGTVGLITTMTIEAGQSAGGMFVYVFTLGTVEPEYKSYTGYYIASAAVLATGVVYLIAAGKNKQKARALQTSIKMEQAPVLNGNGIQQKAYPSFLLSVPL